MLKIAIFAHSIFIANP